MAHGRLRVAEPTRRAREGALLRDGLERHEMTHRERADAIEFVHAQTVPFGRDGARRPSRPPRARVRAPARGHAPPACAGAGGRARGLFIAEGELVIGRALRARLPHALAAAVDAKRVERFARPRARGRARVCGRRRRARCARSRASTCTAACWPRSTAGRCRRPPRCCDGARRVVVLEDVNNHTNVGPSSAAPRRSAWTRVLLVPSCCDPLYRRSVRVTMGEVFAVPYARPSRAGGAGAGAGGRVRARWR